MPLREIVRKLWQILSFLFVIYGFYLFFLFVWDTMLRVKESLALPVALLITLCLMAISGFFWLRKHREHLPIKI